MFSAHILYLMRIMKRFGLPSECLLLLPVFNQQQATHQLRILVLNLWRHQLWLRCAFCINSQSILWREVCLVHEASILEKSLPYRNNLYIEAWTQFIKSSSLFRRIYVSYKSIIPNGSKLVVLQENFLSYGWDVLQYYVFNYSQENIYYVLDDNLE